MAQQDISIDYETISTRVAPQYATAVTDLRSILSPLQAIADALSMHSFIGLTGTAAANQLQLIQSHLSQVIHQGEAIHDSISVAIKDYQTGDDEVAQKLA